MNDMTNKINDQLRSRRMYINSLWLKDCGPGGGNTCE